MFCPNCGKQLKTDARFCGGCGHARKQPATVPSAAPPPLAPQKNAAPSPPPPPQSQPPPPPSQQQAPPPPPAHHQPIIDWALPPPPSTPLRTVSAAAAAPLPPPPGLPAPGPGTPPPAYPDGGGFRDKSTAWAVSLTTKMNGWSIMAGKSYTPMLARMVRGALADRTIYQEVAAAEPAKNETWLVMAIVIGLGVVGGMIFTVRSFSTQILHTILYAAVLQSAGWLARAWTVKAVGGFWLKQPLDFHRVFRPLAYSMTPAAAVGLIPGLGAIISLWCLATNMFAIRDTYRCETGQAIGLSLAGYGGALVAISAIAPLIGRLF